ncbi:uncharacterized protein LOC132716828 [Ruditapes philippinarum]|uniref:uncharacterized protein LOC132716828 n=1 Tax=Ruditapes philippinarum TaxID=129788 RepID=UPI00295B80FA|nr:uncharacterized protein LOC132716828 [Ruditapes philippinarum]
MEKRIGDFSAPDDVHNKCACNHNNTKLQEDILALTSQYCKLESKFCEEKLARLQLNDDTERLKERLAVLEALVRRTGDNSGLCSNNKQCFVEDPNKRDSGNVK